MNSSSFQNISAKIERHIDLKNETVAIISSVLLRPAGNRIFSDDTHRIQTVSNSNCVLWTMTKSSTDDWKSATRSCAQLGMKTFIFIGSIADKGPTRVDGCIVKDHINVSGQNPLIGDNDDRLGARFPDMTDLYNNKLSEILKDCCDCIGLKVQPGILLVPKSLDGRTALEEKILSLRKDIFVSEDVYAGAIVAKHQSLTAAGLVLNSEIENNKMNELAACLYRQIRSA